MPYFSADLIATEFPSLDPISQQLTAGREFLERIERQLARERGVRAGNYDVRSDLTALPPEGASGRIQNYDLLCFSKFCRDLYCPRGRTRSARWS